MNSSNFRQAVRTELRAIMKEAAEKKPDIDAKLESLRKKLEPEMVVRETSGWLSNTRPQKRVAVKTVSDLIDVPVNELMLHLLNHMKTGFDENANLAYHMGQVYFMKEAEDK